MITGRVWAEGQQHVWAAEHCSSPACCSYHPRPAPSPCSCTVGTAASGSSQTGPSYSLSPGSPAAVRGLQACEAQQWGEGKAQLRIPWIRTGPPGSALTTRELGRCFSPESVLSLPPPSKCGNQGAQRLDTRGHPLPAPTSQGEMLRLDQGSQLCL